MQGVPSQAPRSPTKGIDRGRAGPHQREWKSPSWLRKSSKKLKSTVHPASAEEHSLRASPTAWYTALLHVRLCTACAHPPGFASGRYSSALLR